MTSWRKLLFLFLVLETTPQMGFALSEEKEIKQGAAEHQKIVGRFGVYNNPALQEYVAKVGNRIAAQSSRPELKYYFTVLNDDMINAFALPGGFVYITRGMLVHMNSESELAAVLGHEIAHITEKHGLRRKTRGKVQDIVSVGAAILTGQPGIVELGQVLGGVLITGYSREFELEADQVGASYMAKAGYSPEAMLKTIEILKNKDRIEIEQARLEKRPPQVYHGFLSSHPDHDTRYGEAIRESNQLLLDYDEFIRADEFLEQLNGLAYGPSRQSGVVRNSRFYHPRLGVMFAFPEGWRQEQAPRGVQFVSQTGDASFFLTTSKLYKGATPEKFVSERMNYVLREGRNLTIGGMPAFLGIAERVDSPFGRRPVRLAVVFDLRRRIAYIMQGSGKFDLSKVADDKRFISIIFSFGKMARDDFTIARVPKVQVVRAEQGTTMEQLAAQSPISNYALDKLRVINGLYPNGQPEPGQLLKVID